MILLLIIALLRLGQLGSRPQLMSIPEEHKRNQRQTRGDESQDEARVLAAHIVEELSGKQGRDTTQRIPH